MAADQAKPTQAVDTTVDPKEPFEVLWPKYLARVAESVRDAEQHLTVPAGAISSIPSDPDFIATVKTYAVIEPILNDLIVAAYPPRPLLGFLGSSNEDYRTFVTSLNIGGRNGKLELAKALGLATPDQINFIRAVTQIRNRYAHNVRNMHKSLSAILVEEQAHHGNILAHITGTDIKLPSLLGDHYVKLFMYHRLADYLASALQTLRPPPLPDGGILSALLGTGKLSNSPVT